MLTFYAGYCIIKAEISKGGVRMFGKIKEKQLEEEKKYRELKGKDQDELTLSELKFMNKCERKRKYHESVMQKKRILATNKKVRQRYYLYSYTQGLIFLFSPIYIIITTQYLLLQKNASYEEVCFLCAMFIIGTLYMYLLVELLKTKLFKNVNSKLNSYYSSLNSNNSKKETTDVSVLDTDDNADSSSESDIGHLSAPKINSDVKNISSDDDSTDKIIKMMLGNLDEISEYYRLSKRQAGWAFWSAIVSFFAGFVFLGVVIWILLNKSTDTLALIIPAIGTVVSELFGLTIFSVYKKSLNQLNSYYDSLHDNERFISLLYITDKLSDPMQRDELFTQIVKDQISTINRQKTKAEEQNAKKPSGKKVVLVKKNKKNNSKNP